ncbi:hypothetical protein [Chryseobacterium wangxinyae]|uniref:hypothetical protein n=1 Tax=Chryseobacterium sp. CY353 TaxID=2997334 RepID=UPI00226F712A|nr:hypothetical protein [Chryseobacterium sp. CY353]MCY0968520.1 hypothetical protein [Chryseobacterium sp. CY353]
MKGIQQLPSEYFRKKKATTGRQRTRIFLEIEYAGQSVDPEVLNVNDSAPKLKMDSGLRMGCSIVEIR